MKAAQTIQKMYRSRSFLRKWWKSVQLLQAKETKRFLHLGWFIMLILVIVSEAVIIVSNGIEDLLHPHNKLNSRNFVVVLNEWILLFLFVWTITLTGKKDRETYQFITCCCFVSI